MGSDEILQFTGSADRVEDVDMEKFLDDAVQVVLVGLNNMGIFAEVGEVDQQDCLDGHVLRKIAIPLKDFENAHNFVANRVKELDIGKTKRGKIRVLIL